MNVAYAARNLRLVHRNLQWLKAPMPVKTKLAYYPSLVNGYAGLLASRRKSIRYLGRTFCYDNPATPLNLQTYPYEVGIKMLRNMGEIPANVLDIGANIGQFACTLVYFVPTCRVDCIEPNPNIVDLLKRNVPDSVRLFDCAFGSTKLTETFYFEPNRSSIGSFLRNNAGTPGSLQEIVVRVENDAAAVTGRGTYDLVKIDVEGFEFEVIKALKNVRTKYLYIEVSGGGRDKLVTDAQLFRTILETLGDFDVVYGSGVASAEDALYELLLRFL